MKIGVYSNFIAGVMVGFEFVDDDVVNHFLLDLFIVRIDIVWGDIEAYELSGE